jgi:PST family polysaccharide transporter
VQKTLNLMAGLGYAVALPITLLSGPLINLLYGPEFAAAAAPLAVHIWAALFYSLGGVLTLWLVNEGLTRFSLASTLAGAGVNLALNALLIPSYGPMGAAVATVAAYAVTFLVAPFFFGPTRRMGKMMLKALVLRS